MRDRAVKLLVGALFLYFCAAANAQGSAIAPGAIATNAGNGTIGSAGDQGPAIAAQFDYVYAIAVDTAGTYYICDTWNQRIRRVAANGVVSTIAGTGQDGYSGDGGSATAAQLSFPRGIAIGADGSIYIADTGNSRIRKISPNGNIATVAGTGTAGFSGDRGKATAAALRYPRSIAVDSSDTLYIADTWNFRIRKVDTNGLIFTVAGTGDYGTASNGTPSAGAHLGIIQSLAVDSLDNLYATDVYNHLVLRIAGDGGLSVIAGTGSPGYSGDQSHANSAALRYPRGIAVDTIGTLYVADSLNHRVRRITPDGLITTSAGTGSAGFSGDLGRAALAALNVPYGLGADVRGNLFVGDRGNFRVRKARFEPITDAPKVDASGVVNAASLTPPVADASLITFSGSGFALKPYIGAQSPLPRALGGTIVTVDGSPHPVAVGIAESNLRPIPRKYSGWNFDRDRLLWGNPVSAGERDSGVAEPGLFSYGSGNQAVALNSDFSLNGPNNPAARGRLITLYGTGAGRGFLSQPGDGYPALPDSWYGVDLPTVTVGYQSTAAVSMSLATGLVGVLQVSVVVPISSQTGPAVPVTIQLGSTSNTVMVSIK